MGEENNTSDEEIREEDNVNDQEQNNDMGSDDNKNDDENQNDESQDDDANKDGAGDEEDKKDDNPSDKDEDDDADPPMRQGKKYWRKQYFVEKDKNVKKSEEGDNVNEDDGIAPEDEEMVDKVIRKRFGSKFDQMDAQVDKTEVDSFITDNPDFKPYQAKILKFWKHPSRSHLPVESVAYEVAGKDLIKLGAKRGKQADDKAKNEAGGGSSGASPGGTKKIADMSDKEFDIAVEKAKRS